MKTDEDVANNDGYLLRLPGVPVQSGTRDTLLEENLMTRTK